MPGRARTGSARASARDAGAAAARARRRQACAALLLVGLAGCGPGRAGEVTTVDLLSRVKDADRRPAGSALEIEEHTFGGRSRASLRLPGESRLTFTLPLPHRAIVRFQAAVAGEAAAAVAFRVGISDDRFYQTLVEQTIAAADTSSRGWIGVSADLSPFAGRKLSLFFRPDRRRWRLVLGTHVVAGAPSGVYLADPVIAADVDSAREYMVRRAAQ